MQHCPQVLDICKRIGATYTHTHLEQKEYCTHNGGLCLVAAPSTEWVPMVESSTWLFDR
jgi:hypothetical protein